MAAIVWWSVAGLTVILGILLVFSYSVYRRERLSAPSRLSADSHVIETACGRIEYAKRGAGPAVIVSHGIMGGYDQGLVLSQILGDSFTFIAPSRFGYLRSPLPVDASPSAQAHSYVELLDALDIRCAAIVAGSAGGPAAVQFALCHPDRCAALVLASSTTQAYQKIDPLSLALSNLILHLEYAFWLLMKVFPQVMLNYCGVTPALQKRLTSTESAWVHQLIRTLQPVGPRRAGIINDIRQIAALQPASLEGIKVPTLVTHARDDHLVPVIHGMQAAQSIPGARFILMESGGHFGAGNQQTFDQVIEFLRQHLTSRTA